MTKLEKVSVLQICSLIPLDPGDLLPALGPNSGDEGHSH